MRTLVCVNQYIYAYYDVKRPTTIWMSLCWLSYTCKTYLSWQNLWLSNQFLKHVFQSHTVIIIIVVINKIWTWKIPIDKMKWWNLQQYQWIKWLEKDIGESLHVKKYFFKWCPWILFNVWIKILNRILSIKGW